MDPAGVVGVVLAGGRGRRLGGVGKASLALHGRPLLSYPLAALGGVFTRTAVVAKADNKVLPLPVGAELWIEPDEPRHPLIGIATALRRAGGSAVFVCAADLPLISIDEIRAILLADDVHRGSPPGVVVPRAGGRLQPLCALYRPVVLAAVERAGRHAALTSVVTGLEPLIVERRDADPYTNVNTRKELDDLISRT